jgi:hypothetical protein
MTFATLSRWDNVIELKLMAPEGVLKHKSPQI